MQSLTEGEFLQLSERTRHKKAGRLLRDNYQNPTAHGLALYRKIERWLGLSPLPENQFEALSDRYHYHFYLAEGSWQEHNLLHHIHQNDCPSSTPYLPLTIYLDNLRSAFNVGSILRTAEAFRLGTVAFGKQTPYIDNPKVQKTSMLTYDKIPCARTPLEELPRPLIALETDPDAPSLFDYTFPSTFSLLLGNEEYGLSHAALSMADATVRIPLYGFKNSLNVASAFAIAAGVISHQLRGKK
ncbi:MAG: TrmH family RNA methyltransferase [Verrucomicrobia bacterium]|nr:TrmH family RNA methyltransferase [Verrucomicrobiota bacterium]